jgi:DNA-directed RNA polymerase subunit RPC12/RpoP
MGNTAMVRCAVCGYKVGIMIGGTRAGLREYSSWPVTCLNCNAIKNANTRKSPIACADCGSKNVIELQDPRTYAGDGTDVVLMAWERELTNGRCKCPRCQGFELRASRPTRLFD